MSINIQVQAEQEKQLVRDGVIDGDEYADGEVWADALELLYWREHGVPLPKEEQ